jgi:hypothetical protein
VDFDGLVAMFVRDELRLSDVEIAAGIVYGLLLVTVLCCWQVFVLSVPINGARRWIRFSLFFTATVEFAKLALVLFLARFLDRRAGTKLPSFACYSLHGGDWIAGRAGIKEPIWARPLMLAICGSNDLLRCGRAGPRQVFSMRHVPALSCNVREAADLHDRFGMRRLAVVRRSVGGGAGRGLSERCITDRRRIRRHAWLGLSPRATESFCSLPFAHSILSSHGGRRVGLVGALIVVFVFAIFLWRGLRAALRRLIVRHAAGYSEL